MDPQKNESKPPNEKVRRLVDAMEEMSETVFSLAKRAEIAVELFEALKGMVDMFDCVCKKINWDASFLDAEAIQKMNEAPVQARRAIERMKHGSAKK